MFKCSLPDQMEARVVQFSTLVSTSAFLTNSNLKAIEDTEHAVTPRCAVYILQRINCYLEKVADVAKSKEREVLQDKDMNCFHYFYPTIRATIRKVATRKRAVYMSIGSANRISSRIAGRSRPRSASLPGMLEMLVVQSFHHAQFLFRNRRTIGYR